MPEREALLGEIGLLREAIESLSDRLRISQRTVRVWLAVAAVVVVTLVVLGARQVGESSRISERVDRALAAQQSAQRAAEQAQQAAQQVQLDASCRTARDISTLPITKAAAAFTFTFISDFRLQYQSYGCAALLGPLPAPDPRLLPYLEKLGVK